MGITVNVIDCMHGRPAEGIAARIDCEVDGVWGKSGRGRTDENGMLRDWLPPIVLSHGVYRIELDVDSYYATLGIVPRYPRVSVIFRVFDPAEHHLVPMLITPTSHITYYANDR